MWQLVRSLPNLLFAFYSFILIIGLKPLGGPDLGLEDDSGAFAQVWQVVVLLSFLSALLLLFLDSRMGALRQIPLIWWAFIALSVFSIFWSASPIIGSKRLILILAMIMIPFATGYKQPPGTLIAVSTIVLLGVLCLDLVAVAVFPAARHQAGENDPLLVGLWKGLHVHKNVAASVASIAILLAVARVWRHSRFLHLSLGFTGLIMLIGTGSKTSLGLVPVCIFLMLLVAISSKVVELRAFVKVTFCLLLIVLIVTVPTFWNAIDVVITQKDFATGRGTIWAFMLDYAASHPFGAGYGSFWAAGPNGPAAFNQKEILSTFVHGHNGYLDTLVTTGWLGLFIAFSAAVVYPFYKACKRLKGLSPEDVFCFGFLCYFVLHNLTESSLFSGVRVEMLFLVIVVQHLTSPRSVVVRSAPEALNAPLS